MIAAPRTIRILLIEDDASLTITLSDMLRDAGYLVDTASTGRGGLTRMVERACDLAVLDVVLPAPSTFAIWRGTPTSRSRSSFSPRAAPPVYPMYPAYPRAVAVAPGPVYAAYPSLSAVSWLRNRRRRHD